MKILVRNTHIELSPYELGDMPKLEKNLMIYEPIGDFYETTPVYVYDPETMTLRFPKNIISVMKLETLFDVKAEYDNTCDDYQKAIIKLNINPRELDQVDALDFLTNTGKYASQKYTPGKLLEFDTGKGKTYCAICAICMMRVKAGIILDTSGLIEQWLERLTDFTNLSEKEIFIVKGAQSINKILTGKTKKHKLYLISHRTIGSYAKKEGWDKVSELFNKMEIGVKIIDEAHKEFLNTIHIDLYTNTLDTWYLTATAQRSSSGENEMFNKIIGRVPALIMKRTSDEAFVQSAVVTFDSKPTTEQRCEVTTMRGLSNVKYMSYLCEHADKLFFGAICTIVRTCLQKQEGKIAILLGTKAAVNATKAIIEKNFDISIGVYTSDVPKKDKEKMLDRRIILTTFKSFGTGMDVENLRYIVQCESYSSSVIINQCIGRLRAIGGTLMYFEIYDRGFKSRVKQYQKVKAQIMERSINGEITTFKLN